MKYGIPFTRPFTSPFGAPFFGIGSIGPQEPTGFVAKYTAYLVDNFTLVTGDSVNVWEDEAPVTYGGEEVTNGDFSNGSTDWVVQQIWSIAGGLATSDGSSSVSGERDLYQANVFEVGKIYELTFDIVNYTSGTLRIFDGSTVVVPTSLGTKTLILKPTSTILVFNGGTEAFIGSISNISVKAVLTGANDLTQATSANQPKLVEDFTLTQFTASNQPTLVDDAGTWKLDFDDTDVMAGLKPQSGDFTYILRGSDVPNYSSINSRFIGERNVSSARFLNIAGSFRINDDANNVVFLEPWNNESEIAVRLSGNTLSVFMDGVQLGSDTDVTGSTFTTLVDLGNSPTSLNGSIQSLEIYDVAVVNVVSPTETPVQTLTADPLKMRTSANANPTDGQDVAKWYADEFSAYRDARVVFDTDDFMEGLPVQTGDFTYVFTGLNMVVGGGQVIISNSSSSSNFRVDSAGILKFRGDDNVSFDFSATILSEIVGELVFKRTGDDYSAYINGIKFGDTITNTANFEIDSLGLSSVSINGETATLNVFDRALTLEEIQYYSYLRSETGDILLDENGNPLIPATPTLINSYLASSGNYALASKDSNLDMTGDQTWAFRIYADDGSVNGTNKRAFVLNANATNQRTSRVDTSFSSSLGFRINVSYHPTVGATSGSLVATSDYYLPRVGWYYVLIEWDVTGSTMRMYINDTLDPNTLNCGAGVGNSDIYPIGLSTSGSAFQSSNGDNPQNNVRIWNRLLTTSEKTESYNGAPNIFKRSSALVDEGSTLISGLVFDSTLEDSDLTENTGNSTITATGTPLYVARGMKAEDYV